MRTHLVLGGSSQSWPPAEVAAQLLAPLVASDAAADCVVSLVPTQSRMPVNAAVLTPFTCLERLEDFNTRNMHGNVGHLWSLQRLTRLELSGMDVSGRWDGLRRLTALRSLDLDHFDGEAVLRALSTLRSLTALTLWFDLWLDPEEPNMAVGPDWPWHSLGTLSQLQALTLAGFEPSAALVAAQLPQLAATLRDVELYTDAARPCWPG